MGTESILAVIGGLILREVVSAIVSYIKNRNNSITDLQTALTENTYEMKAIKEKLEELTRLKRDVDELFRRSRIEP